MWSVFVDLRVISGGEGGKQSASVDEHVVAGTREEGREVTKQPTRHAPQTQTPPESCKHDHDPIPPRAGHPLVGQHPPGKAAQQGTLPRMVPHSAYLPAFPLCVTPVWLTPHAPTSLRHRILLRYMLSTSRPHLFALVSASNLSATAMSWMSMSLTFSCSRAGKNCKKR